MHKTNLTGPVSGGKFGWPFAAYFGDISQLGYIEEEYFVEGESKLYIPEGELGNDGKWVLREGEAVPFKTRILVHRPTDSVKFNGTVVVDWINVSRGHDVAFCCFDEMYEKGFTYVAVSAQPTGIEGYSY